VKIYMLVHIYVFPYIISMDPVELFKQLSDTTRLRCLSLMVSEGELCVCELTEALGLSQPKISRHLAQLRESGAVQSRRAGHWVHYRLHEDLPLWAGQIIQGMQAGTGSREPYCSDLRALQNMSNRPGSECCT
jgi:DNA-binding transcriptional ArsR family regulator